MKRIGGCLLLLVVLGAQGDPDQAIKQDLKALQGTWVLTAMEANGIEVPPAKLQGTEMTIKDDQYIVKVKDREFKVTLKLDPTKDPKEIDMIFQEGANKEKVHKGIYKIEKDEFKLCRGLNPDQERPNQFGTWPNTNVFMATWKLKQKAE